MKAYTILHLYIREHKSPSHRANSSLYKGSDLMQCYKCAHKIINPTKTQEYRTSMGLGIQEQRLSLADNFPWVSYISTHLLIRSIESLCSRLSCSRGFLATLGDADSVFLQGRGKICLMSRILKIISSFSANGRGEVKILGLPRMRSSQLWSTRLNVGQPR